MAQDLNKNAAAIFKSHPKLEKIFLTSDGQGFSEKERAQSHAITLSEKKVKEFTRENITDGKKTPKKSDSKPLEAPQEDKDNNEGFIIDNATAGE